ncbi:MAG: hypothetical protein E6471_27415, partial [Bradyrhizobium sp.]|nr:hypothetical protein [Bradyrhizobium sp.]
LFGSDLPPLRPGDALWRWLRGSLRHGQLLPQGCGCRANANGPLNRRIERANQPFQYIREMAWQ